MEKKFYPLLNDVVFKKVFMETSNVLQRFLKHALETDDADLAGMQIVDRTLEPVMENGKRGILDIRVKTETGLAVNVELQCRRTTDIEKRLDFYLACMFAATASKGKDYAALGRAAAVLLTNFPIKKGGKGFRKRCRMRYDNGDRWSDSQEIIVLDLTCVPSDDESPLAVLLRVFALKNEEECMNYARTWPEAADVVQALVDVNRDEAARLQAERWDKAERDEISGINAALRRGEAKGLKKGLKKGRAEGLAQGLKKGKAEGLAEGRFFVARNLLRLHASVELVAQSTGLPLEEVQRLAAEVHG